MLSIHGSCWTGQRTHANLLGTQTQFETLHSVKAFETGTLGMLELGHELAPQSLVLNLLVFLLTLEESRSQ